MDYRTLPHGGERISVIGLGMGSIHESSDAEIRAVLDRALEAGVNYFDLCPSEARPFKPYAEALHGCDRGSFYVQMHFGADYRSGKYGWTRNLDDMLANFERELDEMGLGYADFGYVHCIDEDADFDQVMASGLWERMQDLKRQGVIRHLGFSSHEPGIARRFLDAGLVDMCMFSLNPAYDFGAAAGAGDVEPDADAKGTVNQDRLDLYRRFEAEGVGVAVMKAYGGGQLLDAKRSPFGQAFTAPQLIAYALDRPGVVTCLPGIRNRADLEDALAYLDASPEERDYAAVSSIVQGDMRGTCVYCNHCQPCPAGIDIALVNKYYDLARSGDEMARGHYAKLAVNATACLQCGHCDRACSFHVGQQERMAEIAAYFG